MSLQTKYICTVKPGRVREQDWLRRERMRGRYAMVGRRGESPRAEDEDSTTQYIIYSQSAHTLICQKLACDGGDVEG